MAGRGGQRIPRPASSAASMNCQDVSANDDCHLELSSRVRVPGSWMFSCSLPVCSSSWCGCRTKAAFFPGTFRGPRSCSGRKRVSAKCAVPSPAGRHCSFILGCRPLCTSPKGTTVTYIASPRSAADSSERAEDCEQCLTSAFLHLSASSPSEAEEDGIEAILVTSAVQAGWAEQEVREALTRLRSQHLERTSSNEGTTLRHDSGLVPSSSL